MDIQAPDSVLLAEASARYGRAELALRLGRDVKTLSRWEKSGRLEPAFRLAILFMLRGEKEKRPPGDFTFIDLFAGIGGTRRGFEQVGGECVFTSEWDSSAQRTYRMNNPHDDHPIVGDIHELTQKPGGWDLLPEHFDVLVAGFPCQPFSIAGVSKKNSLGRAHGFACEAQGTLFFDIANILEKRRPAAFLLENVKNLRGHDKGNTFRVIEKVLREELNYEIYPEVKDAKGFVPQHRERFYIVGFRRDVGFSWDAFNAPAPDEKVMRDILHPEDGTETAEDPYTTGPMAKVNAKYTLSPKLWNYLQGYAKKHQEQGNGFGFGLVGKDDTARTLSARYYKDGSEILVSQGKRKNPRRLTPRECARLMGFDAPGRRFEIPVADTPAYKQFGNSVVVPVIAEIARIMKPGILELKKESERKRVRAA
ncbi:DNA cytosine methyltransferase [Ramlibacter solisilvae]|uniref:Cytosine-specific methyltransferase n=1 Tax=Ramlibacter tataouinensis TaxID=94132 RepID=A0A127JV63_9BURK|nr:DNA (cytosine-5-)-methyltransferase [Ramlibacter tataouinensis]AMO23908.1 cytosine methyltransferase [Ramlibacter tataouinensis]